MTLFFKIFVFVFGATSSNAKGLLLEVLERSYRMLSIEPRSAAYKANTDALSLQLLSYFPEHIRSPLDSLVIIEVHRY